VYSVLKEYSLHIQGRKWRRYVLPKRRLTFNGLHGVISQKIELFTSITCICWAGWTSTLVSL
jgi:hypothetical protein